MPPASTKLTIPSSWQAHCQLLGLPFTLLAPVPAEISPPGRWLLTLAATDLSSQIAQWGTSEKIWADYQQGRMNWLARKGGKLINFSSFQSSPLQFGVSYHWRGTDYQETSWYLPCDGKLFHLKILGPLGRPFQTQKQQAQEIARSFQCSNGHSPL